MSEATDPLAETLLAKAAEDEAVLQLDQVPTGPFGFHAQQAVEKLLKALLAQLGIRMDRTHDVRKLASRLEEADEVLPIVPIPLSDLNQFAVVYRYDSIPDVEIPDRMEAIETVRLIREYVVARIRGLS